MAEISSTILHDNDDDCNNNGSSYQHTPLTLACWNGDLDLVTFLIDEGADPNGKTQDGILPLHFSCMKSKNLRVLIHLMEYYRSKVDINAATEGKGKTALMYACSLGLMKTVEVLLRMKADVNKQDGRGESAIFYAMKGGHTDIMQVLISHKACVYLRDDENGNLLHHLVASYMRIQQKTFELILGYLVEEEGLDVNTRMRNGTTALHKACQFGLVGVAQYLIQKGGVLEAKKDYWETPLWTHVKSPVVSREMIMMLFNRGANFQVKNLLGMSLIDYSTKLLENDEVTGVLEEVQRVLKRRRMEEMRAKRKAIWSVYERSSPVINFTSPPQSPSGQVDCEWGPEPVPVGEENNIPKTITNGNLSDLGLSISSSSSSSSDSSASSSDDDADSESDSSSLSSISSDDDIPIADENAGDDNDHGDGENSNPTVQVPTVSTTTTVAKNMERVVTRQQMKRSSEGLQPNGGPTDDSTQGEISDLADTKEKAEDIINLSSDESEDDKGHHSIAKMHNTTAEAISETNAPPDFETGGGVLRRSQRNSKRTAEAESDGQAETTKRKKKTIVITISDSD